MTILAIDPSTSSLGFAMWMSKGKGSWSGVRPVFDGCFVPDRTSPRHTLESIERLVEHLACTWEVPFHVQNGEELVLFSVGMSVKRAVGQRVDVLACERMFVSPFQGNAVALLNVVPRQLDYRAGKMDVKFMEIANGTIKRDVGANVLRKEQGRITTKQAVFASVERFMSDGAKALPRGTAKSPGPLFDVSDAHAIAWTAIMQLTGQSRPSTSKAKRATKKVK